MLDGMLGDYKRYIEQMTTYLSRSGLDCGKKISDRAKTDIEQAGYELSLIYWVYSNFELATTASRLLDLPFEIGKRPDGAMRSAIRAEYILYKNNIEPLFDWESLQERLKEKEDFTLPEYEEKEIETDIVEEQGIKVQPNPLGVDEEDLEGDVDDEEDEEPFSTIEDEPIPQVSDFDFLTTTTQDDTEESTTQDDYYSSIFRNTDDFIPIRNTNTARVSEEKVDWEIMRTEYKKEAMFREKMYTWYEKLESFVKLW